MDNIIQFPDRDPDMLMCDNCGNVLFLILNDRTRICPVCDTEYGDEDDSA